MADRVYLRKQGDEGNLIEVDSSEIMVVVKGEKNSFRKWEIINVQLLDIREISALAAGVLLGVIGARVADMNLLFGLALVAIGAATFHFGMGWQRKLLIHLESRMIYRLTFFHRGVRDIENVLSKHGYIARARFPWFF